MGLVTVAERCSRGDETRQAQQQLELSLPRRGRLEVIEMRSCQGCGVAGNELLGLFCGDCDGALHEVLSEMAAVLENTPVGQRAGR